MPDAPVKYERLPGSGAWLFQRYRLWVAPDHLLQVGYSVIGERYKRFYFADIQAVVVRRTALFWVLGGLLGLAAATPLTVVALVDGPEARVAAGIVAGLLLLLLVVHLVRGPTCETTVRTAVQLERLPSLNRVRTQRKVLDRIRPLIAQAQAGVGTRTAAEEFLA